MSAELATVSFRTESGVTEDESWTAVDSAVLSKTVPWRKFRWYKGQRHYSGTYWSATMHDHVVYESRLELRPRGGVSHGSSLRAIDRAAPEWPPCEHAGPAATAT